MTKDQLNNLISFSFNFHETMGNKVLDCDSVYLLEKWEKYIGVSPKNTNISYDYFLENKTYFHLVIRRWFEKWDKRGENWNKVLPIINFINEINLLDPSGRFGDIMTPEDLIKLFNNHIGDVNNINKDEYKHLHHIVGEKVDNWVNKLKREYNLTLILY